MFAAALGVAAPGSAAECTKSMYLKGDAAYDAFARDEHHAPAKATWKRLVGVIVKYHHCDDGELAEGFSDAVCRWLALHWDRMSEVVGHCRGDREGCRLAFRHIDATCGYDDVPTILKKARTACPNGAANICDEIAERATAAIHEGGDRK